jgi:hypothetical protein
VALDGRCFPSATGTSRKHAEQRAAQLAFEALQADEKLPTGDAIRSADASQSGVTVDGQNAPREGDA